ncbi:sensor histidine kinase [Amycolatopsis nigrescens]|uniref:sensor histidine kinase n=1 Tax=Amycolatopsis nigrescens TaxID=381445 RepID=UPI00036F3E8E|nr:sensor histidine kinase [Amycolatopsis nigrescens]
MSALAKRLFRDVPYLLALVPASMVALLIPLFLAMAGMSVAVAGLGLVLVPFGFVGLRIWTDLHRTWAGYVLGRRVPTRLRPLEGSILSWWRQLFTDPATWRDLLWLPVQCALGFAVGMLSLILCALLPASILGMFFWWAPGTGGVTLIPSFPIHDWGTAFGTGIPTLLAGIGALVFVLPTLARGWAHLTRSILDRSGTEQLAERVDELTETRAEALDAHGAELRRIERDLHDGTQAKLVSIALRLGIAKQTLRDEPETAATLLQEARDGTEAAMGELRTIVRTIYPPILSDRGLVGALRSLVADAAVPVHADLEEVGPLPASVEAAAYFVVSEALTNVAKHAGARLVMVSVRRVGDRLDVEVTDDGRGGIDETAGTGVNGIRRRVAALDGIATVHSPAGGPTTIRVELPCAP